MRFPHGAMKLRWHLTVLLLVSVVPLVVFGVIVVDRLQREERARFEQELVQVTRNIAVAIDRELLGLTKALQALASPALLDDDGRLSTFERRARELLAVHESWHDVVLIDPDTIQTIKGIRRPVGSSPVPADDPDAVREVVAHRRPIISDSFVAGDSARRLVALLAPVEREGALRYVLGAYYDPANLMALVAAHDIPHLWAVGVVDRKAMTIARSRGVEFVGKPANPRFVQMAPASGVAFIQLPTLEGVPAYGGIARSPLTGWLIGVSRSGHPVEASIRRSGWTLASVGLLFLVLGLLLAALLASRITRPMVALSQSTTAALTDGGLEALTRSGVSEIARLARAVADAEREREALVRREAEAETEKLRSELAHVGRVSVMGELSASLAHELNQPLTAIAVNARAVRRMLDATDGDRSEIQPALDDIVADSGRATEVIRRLRSLFRNEATERRPLDLNELIRGVATLVHGEVDRHGITLAFELDPALPAVTGDVVQIQQVVLNLLVNACEALGATGDARRRLMVTTARRAPAQAQVSVSDTGIGMKDQEAERVFAPFVSSKPDGLGMGLAISRSIIEAHGGRIWAVSKPDRGATFHFTLPLAEEPRA